MRAAEVNPTDALLHRLVKYSVVNRPTLWRSITYLLTRGNVSYLRWKHTHIYKPTHNSLLNIGHPIVRHTSICVCVPLNFNLAAGETNKIFHTDEAFLKDYLFLQSLTPTIDCTVPTIPYADKQYLFGNDTCPVLFCTLYLIQRNVIILSNVLRFIYRYMGAFHNIHLYLMAYSDGRQASLLTCWGHVSFVQLLRQKALAQSSRCLLNFPDSSLAFNKAPLYD